MKIIAPDYYGSFRCIADKCAHTCCVGWEIDIDEGSLPRFIADELIAPHVDLSGEPHIRLLDGERCPFLRDDGLCDMIIRKGEESLCGICRDHPRFRSYWTGITELGLGLVCEEAGRLILGRSEPMRLTVISDDGEDEPLPEDEKWLWDVRRGLLENIDASGAYARLREYLIYRHLPDAVYDGMVEERIRFIDLAYDEITEMWKHTGGTLGELAECARRWSYDVEYDDEALASRLRDLT